MILDGTPPRAFAAVAGDDAADQSELVAIARGIEAPTGWGSHRSGLILIIASAGWQPR
jgi:hypothetical protein